MSDKPQFTILGTGYFRDNQIHTTLDGVQYQNEFLLIKEDVEHGEAQELATACTDHGGGWDLPDPRDFLVCVTYDDPKDARHPELKDVLHVDWVWMKKQLASNSVFAWFVSLNLGFVYYDGRGGNGLAVGVRRVPPSQ